MRIVIDLQCCQNGSRHRGIGRYATALTKALIAQRGEHEILIFLTDRYLDSVHAVRSDLKDLLPQGAISVCRLFEKTEANNPSNAWRTRAAEVARIEFLVSLEPDIVFVPSLFEGFCDGVVTSVDKAPFQTAVTLHDFIPLEEPHRHLSGQHDWASYARKTRDVRRADLLIAISSHTANGATRFLQVDPTRVIVVPNGVEARFTPPPSDGSARPLDRFGIQRPFVFNASPLEHRKNLEGLIAGYARMSRETIATHQLVIAGRMDASAKAYLLGRVEREGLSRNSLVLPGYVSDEDLIELYGKCALFAFPSFSEGFGLPPLEAMACGAPVISSNTTSLPEVIGRADLLVDPKDPVALAVAMERVLEDPALGRELREFSIRRASCFSWAAAATKVLEAFERTLCSRTAAPVLPASTEHRIRLAIVLPAVDENNAISGQCTSLVPALERLGEITIIREQSTWREPWLEATVNHRSPDWLERQVSRIDAIIYITGDFIDEAMALRMAMYPGITLRLREPMLTWHPDLSGDILPLSIRYALLTTGGIGLLSKAMSGTISSSTIRDQARALPLTLGCRVLDEGELPRLPLARSTIAASEIRRGIGITADVPLIVGFVLDEGSERRLRARFIEAAVKDAVLLIHRIPQVGNPSAHRFEKCMGGSIHAITGDLASCYRGLISSADVLLLPTSIDTSIKQVIEADARAMNTLVVADADNQDGLSKWPSFMHFARDRMDPIAGPATDSAIERWLERISGELGRWRRRSPSMLERVALRLPALVRDTVPDSDDLGHLAACVATNAALDREPLTWLDLSAYVEPGPTRQLDQLARTWLISLLEQGGPTIHPVRADKNGFVRCDRFVLEVLGLGGLRAQDDLVAMRPGDRVVGLAALHSYETKTFPALAAAHAFGATLFYVQAISGDPAVTEKLIDRILAVEGLSSDGPSTSNWLDAQADLGSDTVGASSVPGALPIRIFRLDQDLP